MLLVGVEASWAGQLTATQCKHTARRHHNVLLVPAATAAAHSSTAAAHSSTAAHRSSIPAHLLARVGGLQLGPHAPQRAGRLRRQLPRRQLRLHNVLQQRQKKNQEHVDLEIRDAFCIGLEPGMRQATAMPPPSGMHC